MRLPVEDPVLVFTVLVSVIMIAPLLAERLRMPDLVLLLIAGTLLGPHVGNVLREDAAIVLFGSVGLLYIMFQAGLEIDITRFVRTRQRSITFGLLTFFIPQVLGALGARYLLGMNWSASVLLASMFASHTLLAYPVASRLGIARSEPVAITVGATIITDTMALMVLAIIADTARGMQLDLWFWLWIAAGMATLGAVTLYGIPRISRWFFRHVPEKGGAQFLFVIAVVCGCAYLSHYAKLEPIIGAFLAGIAFNRLIPPHSTLMNRVTFVGETLFIPLFLIWVGMMVNPHALMADSRSWVVAAYMVAAVTTTKYAAAYIARRLFGYDAATGHVMFGLSVVQAAATLAAVIVGHTLRIFDDSVLNGTIAMILVSCPLGSWVVDRAGRRMAIGQAAAQRRSVARGQQRVLVSVANPVFACQLLDLAFFIRDTTVPGGVFPVAVVSDDDESAQSVQEGEKLLGQCLAHAAAAEIEVSAGTRVALNVADGIVRASRDVRADMVMLGWPGGRTPIGRLFRSMRDTLLEDCPAQLLFCRFQYPLNTTRRVLLALAPLAERGPGFQVLLSDVKRLAREIGAHVHMLLCHPSDTGAVRALFDAAGPEVEVTVHEQSAWRRAGEWILAQAGVDDLVVLPLQRQQSVLWTPGMDSLAARISSRLHNASLLIWYPAQDTSLQAGENGTAPDSSALCFQPVTGLEHAADVEAVIARMAAQIAGNGSLVYEPLVDSARWFPVEMLPGVVLLHTQCDEVREPIVLLAFSSRGWQLSGVETPVRCLLALLMPRFYTAEHRLKVMAGLARCVGAVTVSAGLQGAQSVDEVMAVLRSGAEARSETDPVSRWE